MKFLVMMTAMAILLVGFANETNAQGCYSGQHHFKQKTKVKGGFAAAAPATCFPYVTQVGVQVGLIQASAPISLGVQMIPVQIQAPAPLGLAPIQAPAPSAQAPLAPDKVLPAPQVPMKTSLYEIQSGTILTWSSGWY